MPSRPSSKIWNSPQGPAPTMTTSAWIAPSTAPLSELSVKKALPRQARRGILKLQPHLGEHLRVPLALDVGVRQRFGDLDEARQPPVLHREPQARRRGRLPARLVLLPGRGEVVEPIERGLTHDRTRARQLAAQLGLRAQALVAGDLGDLEAATEALAADLVALAVRQHVRGLLTERVEAHAPALREAQQLGDLQFRDQEILAARVVDDVERFELAAERVEAAAHLQADEVLAGGSDAAADASAELEHAQLLAAQPQV